MFSTFDQPNALKTFSLKMQNSFCRLKIETEIAVDPAYENIAKSLNEKTIKGALQASARVKVVVASVTQRSAEYVECWRSC